MISEYEKLVKLLREAISQTEKIGGNTEKDIKPILLEAFNIATKRLQILSWNQ